MEDEKMEKPFEMKVELDMSVVENLMNNVVDVNKDRVLNGIKAIDKILKQDIEDEKLTPLEFTYLNNLALELETTILAYDNDDVLLIKFK